MHEIVINYREMGKDRMAEDEENEKEAFLSRVESCLREGLYQVAQDLALDWLNRFPGDAEVRVVLCHAWTRMGKLDKVKQMIQEVDEAIFGMSLIYARMGDICQRSGLNQEAITFYRKFLDLNPHSPITQEIAAKLDTLASSGEDSHFPELEEEAPRRPLPGLQTVTMAELYIKQGHPDLAEAVLEAILEKDKANQRAWAMLKTLRGEAAVSPQDSYLKSQKVIQELNRWLSNLDRIRPYAA